MTTFEKVLELAEELSPREQASFVQVLSSRLQTPNPVIRDAELSRADFDAGNYKVSTPEEIMREIQS